MSGSDKVNILLVDDQPAKLLSYEVILQHLGENLLKASSASQALEHLLKHNVAVILMDVFMPGLDGFELAEMIREHPRCRETAIIFISAVHLTDADRLRGYAMGAVDYVPVPVIAEVLQAKVKVFTELYRKARQLEQLNQELENRVAERTAELQSYTAMLLQSEKRRNLALAAGKMGSWDWDLKRGDCMWDNGLCEIFGVDPKGFKVTPERVKALVDPEDWQQLTEAWFNGFDGSRSYESEFRVRGADGEVKWCTGTAAATMDEGNRLVRVSGVVTDITDRKQAEERQSILAREVDHRARNLLAVVQSILRLTKTQNVDAYVAAVEGRIKALSVAHNLISESRWEGADLARLAAEELEPYRAGDAISMNGPPTMLHPRRAHTHPLAVHELAPKAANYGALGRSSGKVKFSWRNDRAGLTIEWQESGGPTVRPPDSQGYGTRVIRASLEQLGGRAVFDWRPSGLCCILSFPHDKGAKRAEDRTDWPGFRQKQSFQFELGTNAGKVLLVEDESVVAMMVEEFLSELGLCVVGPFGSVDDAMRALKETFPDAAVLDINIGDESVYPVADILLERKVPVAFISGYGAEAVDPRYAHLPLVQKPIDRKVLVDLFSPYGAIGDSLTASRRMKSGRA
jgi:PAS domain S-box-containing protein